MDYEDAHNGRGLSGAHGPNPARSIIGAEDEDFENDLHQTVDDQCSHFNSIELLKNRPTHLLVFLHHVILQFDCAPLLCYLHADLLKNLGAKDTKKAFGEFYNNFLDKGAILRVPIPAHVLSELDRNRPDLSEDMQRRFAQDVQNVQATEVLRQLDDFRKKRMMGMTPNELELTEVENHYQTDRVPREMKEKAVAERLLEKLFENNPSIVADEEKASTIFSAVAVYMKQLGVKTRVADSKKSRGFFKRKAPKKDEGKGIRGILVEAGRYLPSVRINDVKRLDTEGDKDKSSHERKGSGSLPVHGGPSSEGSTAPIMGRKPGLPVLGTLQNMEVTEAPLSSTVISCPDTSHTETGQSSNPLDHRSVSEGVDASPGPGIPICDLTVTVDSPVEEGSEKERSVRRSESLCVDRRHPRRSSARAKQSRSRSDVDLQSTASSHPPSPSPHHSFVDMTLFQTEVSSPVPASTAQQEEIEPRLLELEQDPANWRELASNEALSKLSKKEMKRQEVINELFVTEHAHVRMLSVLQTVFAHPLEKEMIINTDELRTIFPSLDDIIEVHYTFYQNLKKLRQEDDYVVKKISTPLLNRFNGSEGDWFQKLSARFCSHQSYTLVQIKNRQKKDPRFNAFILEAESKPQCRRLQLKDIIPIEMQRLTKYPLLLENIAKSTEDNEERELIQQAAECCRKILNHVNEEVKHMENLLTLNDYQRRLDTSGLKPSNELYMEYKGLDLTSRSMIFEGLLTWRVTKEKALDVQAVLLRDLLVLLQKQDDKMVLKCQSKSTIAVQEGKQMLSPIIKLDSAFLREVATDRKAFYVIFTWESGAQIYELVAQSVGERKMWTDSIKATVEELKKSGGPVPDRKRLGSMPASSSAMADTMSSHPPLSPTENGPDPLKNSSGKDGQTYEKGRRSHPSLIDFLTANGFDPLSYDNGPPERAAPGAVDEVITLKTLLAGELCLSEEAKSDGESGAESGKQEKETDGDEGRNAEGQEDGGDESAKRYSDRKTAAPLVLPQEHVEDVFRRLDSLLEQIKRLQNIEEEHHRLQEALAKFTIQRVNYN